MILDGGGGAPRKVLETYMGEAALSNDPTRRTFLSLLHFEVPTILIWAQYLLLHILFLLRTFFLNISDQE